MTHLPILADSGPDADLSQLFPPRLLAWLLGKGCVAARWTAARNGAPPVDVPAAKGQVVEFNFCIGSDPVVAVGLRLYFRSMQALDGAGREAVSNYLAALGRLLPGASPIHADRVVTVPWQTIVVAQHQVRNHLNSLLMNASALAILGGEAEGLDIYVQQMQRDVEKCLSVLQLLFDSPA